MDQASNSGPPKEMGGGILWSSDIGGEFVWKDAAEALVWKEPLDQLREQSRESKDKHQRLEATCLSLLNSLNHYDNHSNSTSSQDGPWKALNKIQNCRSTEATSSAIFGIATTKEEKERKFWCQSFGGLERCKDLSKLNAQEQKVQECIDVALADVHQLQAQINAQVFSSTFHGLWWNGRTYGGMRIVPMTTSSTATSTITKEEVP